MSAVLNSETPVIRTNFYTEDQARKAISEAMKEAQRLGLDAEATRHLIHRHYPFSNGDRGGKEYKCWLKLAHEAERALGLPARKHVSTVEREKDAVKKFDPPNTKEELLRRYPEIETAEQASFFLRRNCVVTVTMKLDHDRIRCVFKGNDSDDFDVKKEWSVEVDADQQEDYNDAFIEVARKARKSFLEVELSKY
jgi:hypothetical protein